MLTPNYFDGYIMVRLKEGNHLKAVNKIKSVWGEFTETNPLTYYFFEDDFKKLYNAEEHTRKLMELFSLLAIIVGALGLFGLVSYSVTTRTREIGIRKSNGADTLDIMALIIKDNIKPIIYSVFISFPLAWFLMHNWLQNFAYRIGINIVWFILVLFTLLFIGSSPRCSRPYRPRRSIQPMRYVLSRGARPCARLESVQISVSFIVGTLPCGSVPTINDTLI